MPRYTGDPTIDTEIERKLRQDLWRIDLAVRRFGYDGFPKEELARAYAFASSNVRRAVQSTRQRPSNLPIAPAGDGASFQHPFLTGPMPPRWPAEHPMNLKLDPREFEPSIPRLPGQGSAFQTLETS